MADIQACFNDGVKHPLTDLLKNAYMPTIGERIQERIDELAGAVKVADIARVCGSSEQAVYQWISGATKQPKPTNVFPAARILGVHPEWLIKGQPPKLLGNTEPGPVIQGRVPLISWVQAGDFASIVDNHHPGDADDWELTTAPIHRHTYALRIRGDSMTNPNGMPTFPHGQVIIVEPDLIDAPENLTGQFVIIKRVSDDEATFKQFGAGRWQVLAQTP